MLVRIGFTQLDPRILPDMGVKVTFLREADGATPRRRPGRWRSCRRAPSGPRATTSVRLRRRAATPSSAARCRPAAPTAIASKSWPACQSGERVVVSPPATLADGHADRRQAVSEHASMSALVRVRDVHKYFTRGSERIDVLQGRQPRDSAGRLPRADGAVRLGQDDAAQPDRRPRHADAAARSRSAASNIAALSGGAARRAGARSTSASSSSSTTCCRC